jgi:hypothetical protein
VTLLNLRSEVLKAVTISWDMAPYNFVEGYRRSEEMYCLHLQSRKVSRPSKQRAEVLPINVFNKFIIN